MLDGRLWRWSISMHFLRSRKIHIYVIMISVFLTSCGESQSTEKKLNIESEEPYEYLQADEIIIIDKSIWENGSLEEVNKALSEVTDINHRYDNGMTPLSLAAFRNTTEVVIEIIKHGAYIDLQSDNGMTPLMFAAINNQFEVASVLINAGAKVNHRSVNNMTPIFYSTFNEDYDVARILLEAKADLTMRADDGQTPFHYLVRSNNNAKLISLFLTYGAVLNETTNRGNWSPLMLASFSNCKDVIIELVNMGADLSVKSSDGKTAFDILNLRIDLDYNTKAELLSLLRR